MRVSETDKRIQTRKETDNMEKIIISKEDFIAAMDDVMAASDYQSGLNQYFKDHDVDGFIFQPDCTCTVIRLLHSIFGESDHEEWISYFCFELDFGRKWKEGCITDNDGKEIRLSNAKELYEHLNSLCQQEEL